MPFRHWNTPVKKNKGNIMPLIINIDIGCLCSLISATVDVILLICHLKERHMNKDERETHPPYLIPNLFI